jgi:hypothetical protein
MSLVMTLALAAAAMFAAGWEVAHGSGEIREMVASFGTPTASPLRSDRVLSAEKKLA